MRHMIMAALVCLLPACAARTEAPVAVAPVASRTSPARADLIADGRDIAEAQCAACHAVGVYGESPVAQAPVFRTVLSRYRAEVLDEELIQGIRVAHPMPEFQFNPQGADSLIAYLQSIQTRPRG